MKGSVSPKRLIIYLVIFIPLLCLALIVKKNADVVETSSKLKGDGRPTVKYGMSLKEVKKLNPGKFPIRVGDMLVYKNKALPCIEDIVKSDYKCSVTYEFSDGKLYAEHYRMTAKKNAVKNFAADYYDIQSILTHLYGKPDGDELIWKNGAKKLSLSSYTIEDAVLSKELRLWTLWFLEDGTQINLSLEYNYDEILILISYQL